MSTGVSGRAEGPVVAGWRGWAGLGALALWLGVSLPAGVLARGEDHGEAADSRPARPARAGQPRPADGAPGATMTKERQAAITPDSALRMLQEGNARFVTGRSLKRDLRAQVKATAHGQFPFASVVSCIDSRAAPELVFDLGVGDVFGARVAGNVVNRDILGSLEYASKVAGSRLVVVLGHSHCGAVKGACDGVRMGNLTGLLEKLKPALDAVPEDGSPRNSRNEAFVELVAEANVRATVRRVLEDSTVLADLVRQGRLKVVGALLDVETGKVRFLEPEAAETPPAQAPQSLHL